MRDDGPLPDVYTDVIDGQRAMRAKLTDVGFCLMVATMLHSVATGNILPASIPLVCVDINPATVTKLADRGSSQARGIVTDVGLFLEQLASELVEGYRTNRGWSSVRPRAPPAPAGGRWPRASSPAVARPGRRGAGPDVAADQQRVDARVRDGRRERSASRARAVVDEPGRLEQPPSTGRPAPR